MGHHGELVELAKEDLGQIEEAAQDLLPGLLALLLRHVRRSGRRRDHSQQDQLLRSQAIAPQDGKVPDVPKHLHARRTRQAW